MIRNAVYKIRLWDFYNSFYGASLMQNKWTVIFSPQKNRQGTWNAAEVPYTGHEPWFAPTTYKSGFWDIYNYLIASCWCKLYVLDVSALNKFQKSTEYAAEEPNMGQEPWFSNNVKSRFWDYNKYCIEWTATVWCKVSVSSKIQSSKNPGGYLLYGWNG